MLSARRQGQLWKIKHNVGDSALGDSSLPTTERVNPAALPVEDAARAMGLSLKTVRADIAAGVPTNADGAMDLVHYVAWLNGKVADGK
jgi:hypothetical protein